MAREEMRAARSFFRIGSNDVELTTISANTNFVADKYMIFTGNLVFLNKFLDSVNELFIVAVSVSPYDNNVLTERSAARDGRAFLYRQEVVNPLFCCRLNPLCRKNNQIKKLRS